MKRLALAFGLAALVLVPLFANGSHESAATASKQKVVVLRIATDQPATHPYTLGADHFAKYVEAATNGQIKIKVYPNSQLGSGEAQMEDLQLGSLDFSVCAFAHAQGFVKQLDLFSAPFLFANEQQFKRVFDGQVGKVLDQDALKEANVRLLSTFTGGFRVLITKKPIRQISDLKGVKIRVMGGKANSLTWSVFGAIPAPLDYNEVYSALQSGVVDGMENEPVSILQNKFYEAAPYLAVTNHLVLPMGLFMSEKTLQKFPKKEQAMFFTAAQKAAQWERSVIGKDNAAALKEMQQKYHETITHPSIPALQKIGMPVQNMVAKDDNVENLLAMVRAAEK